MTHSSDHGQDIETGCSGSPPHPGTRDPARRRPNRRRAGPARVGLEASRLSHRLAVLRRTHIVTSRGERSNVIDTVADQEIVELLAVARRFLINSLTARRDLLTELRNGVR